MKISEFRKLIREEVAKMVKENGPLMSNPSTKQKVDMVIQALKDMDVDGETMEYILKQVGMEEQMLHQLTPGGIREQGAYSPGSSDANDWDSGIHINIKTKLTPEQQKAIIKQTNKMFDGGKIVPGQGGKFMLYVPFGGDYANAVGILKKLGIKM